MYIFLFKTEISIFTIVDMWIYIYIYLKGKNQFKQISL